MQVIQKYIPENEQPEWEHMIDQLDLGELHEDELVRRLSKRLSITEHRVWAEVDSGPQLNTRLLEYIKTDLKPNYKIGLLTNAARSFIERILVDYLDLFEFVIISSDYGVVKPDPRIYEIAISTCGYPANEICFTDDKERNIAGATSAGMKGIVYTGLPQFKDELQKHLS